MERMLWSSVCLVLLSFAWAAAQETPVDDVTATLVDVRQAEAERDEALDATAKAKVKQLYQQARQELEAARRSAEEAAAFDQLARSAADDRQSLRTTLAAPPAELSIPALPSPGSLQQLLQEQQAELDRAREEFNRAHAEPVRRQARLLGLPFKLEDVRTRQTEVDQQLRAPAPPGEPPGLSLARQTMLRARRQALRYEQLALQKEQAAYAATDDLLPLQRDVMAARVAAAEANVRKLTDAISGVRLRDIERAVQDARRRLDLASPALRSLEEETLRLAQKNRDIAGRLEPLADELFQVQVGLEQTKQDSVRTREKIAAVGLTDALGVLLRAEQGRLSKLRARLGAADARRETIRSVQLELFELEDARLQLASLDDEVALAVAPLPEATRAASESQARDALLFRRRTLDLLLQHQRLLFERLVTLDSAALRWRQEIDDYDRYIEERVLWIRSTAVLGPADFGHLERTVRWLLDPRQWTQLGGLLIGDFVRGPLRYFLAVGLIGLLVVNRGRLVRIVIRAGQEAEARTCRQYRPTLKTLLATGLLATTLPASLAFVGWRLGDAGGYADFARAVGAGLWAAAAFVAGCELPRQIVRSTGLAAAHFGWPDAARRRLRASLWWLTALGTPLVLVAETLQNQADARASGSLGRLCLLALLPLVAWFAHRVLHPRGPVYEALGADVAALAQLPDGAGEPRWPIRRLVYFLAVATPLAEWVLALLGYQYTALQLVVRVQWTWWLVVGLYTATALIRRWFLIHRRKLAYGQRVEAAMRPAESPGSAGIAGATGIAVAVPQEMDLVAIDEQSRQLLRVLVTLAALAGLWGIWVDVLPAVNRLHDVVLWQAASGSRVEPVTLVHLLGTLGVLCVTFVAVKNIPGLLELLLLQRLPLDAGARYAVTTICRYVLMVVGLAFGLGLLRIEWSQYGWLVAAATVGLGFGLQEIFANFVSGLIVLLERPVRVGDVVTVGDVTGVVSRIRMRATTITNWDRQELVVPNKEFVTGKLLNWTLSNAVNRLVVQVGVAYGSDTGQVRDLLLDVARQNANLLPDPEPTVTLEQFGESALIFVLRCYLPNLERRLETIHDLHRTINERFRAVGIEVPYPQRDVHVRSLPESFLRPPSEQSPEAERLRKDQ